MKLISTTPVLEFIYFLISEKKVNLILRTDLKKLINSLMINI